MLRMDCYPVMDGLLVRFAGSDPSEKGRPARENGAAVSRLIATEDIEALGLNDALRQVFVDIATEYPGLLGYALR